MGSRSRHLAVVLAAWVVTTLALGTAARGHPRALGASQRLAQVTARLGTLASRALCLPASIWPVNRVIDRLAHGEPMAGLTARTVARVATTIARKGGTGVVVGRLAWELYDPWSVRGAERSYRRLVSELVRARGREPRLRAAITLDPESLGLHLIGLGEADRRRIAGDTVLDLAREAYREGLDVELDMGMSDAMPHTLAIAHRLAEAGIPVRLALAARYPDSKAALKGWAALSQRLRRDRLLDRPLGVRLVKGSYLEADAPEAIHERGPLLDQYRQLITQALELRGALDVVVGTHNREIWKHAKDTADDRGVPVRMNAVRGIQPKLQAEVRETTLLSQVYVSYGLDAVPMGVRELLHNWRQARILRKRGVEDID